MATSPARRAPDRSRRAPGSARPVARLWPTPPTAIEERRVVTVLFADLVGYTTLAEHLDPEAVTRLIESCFQPLVVEIEAFGGRVDKVLGDAIIALFGAPVAHEDDADRAVRAALRMQETLDSSRRRARRSRRPGGRHPDAHRHQHRRGARRHRGRLRLHRDGRRRQHRVAPPGTGAAGRACSSARRPRRCARRRSRASRSARRSSAAASRRNSRGSSPGRPPPVRARCVATSRSSAASTSWRCSSRSISLVRTGHSGVVSIVGEPGCGKSRIADHIVTQLADEAIVLETACAPYGETSLWSPMRNGLATLLALDPDATADDVRRAVEQRSKELWSLQPGDDLLERLLGVIAYLFGHPSELDELDPAGVRDRVADVVTEAMRSHAQTRMTVLWVDNLQWADPMVRDLLAVVVRSLADLPFLLITSQRSDDDLAWPPPQLDRSLLLRVPLGPLSLVDGATLVRLLLERDGSSELPVDDARRRARRARRRQPVVPRRARRPGDRRTVAVGAAGFVAGADRRPPRPAAADTPGRRRQRRRARAERLDDGPRGVRHGDAAGVLAAATSRSWRPTASSSSTAAGGGSAATSSARSPTRRSPSAPGRSATPAWRWRSPPRRASTST